MTVVDVPLFEGVSDVGILLLVALYFLAFVIKGIFGFGAIPPLVVFGALITEPHHAVLLAAVAISARNCSSSPRAFATAIGN